ncbi:Uncharacterised protein [Segatella copri]|nr:Uncharacterised protein [Segatella copri]
MEYECLIIFYQGDVVATQSSCMGTHRQAKEIIPRLALLSINNCRKKRQYCGNYIFFHLNFLILWQRYCFFQ